MGLLLNPLMIVTLAGMMCVSWTLASEGTVYTRWGRTSCPIDKGTELLYSGRAGGTRNSLAGGAANFLCLPNDPQYSGYNNVLEGYSPITGVQYKIGRLQPLRYVHDTNMPCAVCYTPYRGTMLMIPAKMTCPTSWTTEYTGYLLGGPYSGSSRYLYECVDQAPESVPGSAVNANNAEFYQVEATCDSLACPPYHSRKELTCVVCTR